MAGLQLLFGTTAHALDPLAALIPFAVAAFLFCSLHKLSFTDLLKPKPTQLRVAIRWRRAGGGVRAWPQCVTIQAKCTLIPNSCLFFLVSAFSFLEPVNAFFLLSRGEGVP